MNWLAHLFLSQSNGEHRLGNLLGDILKGKERKNLASCFQPGLECHLLIDAFTDSHPVVRRSKRRIDPQHRRYSGILIDVFYDYILARNWRVYAQVDLSRFTQEVYNSLLEPLDLTPTRVQKIIHRMIQEDWLGSYYYASGVEATLYGIKARLSSRHDEYFLVDAFMKELKMNYQEIEADFHQFFPELISRVKL